MRLRKGHIASRPTSRLERRSTVRTLSKSDFVLARTCPTKLYYRKLGYSQKQEDLSLFAESGYMVEALAKARHPDGLALSYGGDPNADAERTREHLGKDRG
jgi:hypothetical protein